MVKSLCICGVFGEKKTHFSKAFLLIFAVSNLELSSPLKDIHGIFSQKTLVGAALEAH